MSAQSQNPDSIYTQQVKQLLNQIYPQDNGYGSVFEDASNYYSISIPLEAHIDELNTQLERLDGRDDKEVLAEQLKKQISNSKSKLEEERLSRLERLDAVASKIIELCEGDNWQETQELSAKLLGTIMLLTRGPEGKFARVHQRFKPLYKAVLTLRIVDRLLNHDAIAHNYLSKYRESLSRFRKNKYWKQKWFNELGKPLITASMLQDIGLQSPAALSLLKGEDGKQDEFRLLDETQRKALLKLNYHFTLKYLIDGLGVPHYVGNSREEKERVTQTLNETNDFLIKLVKDAFLSKTGLGEILKIPQIYVSIVLSTKPDYCRSSLPKGYMLIEQLAKKGGLNKQLAQEFIDMVGYFPQGFGINFIPINDNGTEKEQYECAIVTGLNPKDPSAPVCKVVTRNRKYITTGGIEVITKERNLYFQAARKKLMRMGKDRLGEIMGQLSNNFTADSVDDLIPSFWEPYDFFSFKKHQNLWVKK